MFFLNYRLGEIPAKNAIISQNLAVIVVAEIVELFTS